MNKQTTIIAAAALLWSVQAHAQEASPTVRLTPDGAIGNASIPASGGVATFSVDLTRGQDFSVAGRPSVPDEATGTVELRSPGGGLIRRVETYGDLIKGFEYRAADTATYFVKVRVGPTGGEEPTTVIAQVNTDCRAGISTRCALQLGATTHAVPYSFDRDFDWFRVRLVAGRTYEALLSVERPGVDKLLIQFRAADKTVLVASTSTQIFGDGSAAARVTFMPRATGDYFVNAVGDDAITSYDVGVFQR